MPHFNSNHVKLENVFYVLEMKKNFVSVSQLLSVGKFVVFEPGSVKVYHNLKVSGMSLMEGRRIDSIYVMSSETTYVNKTRKSEIVDMWHARFSHFSYRKLKIMMNKSMLKGLPQLDVKEDMVYAGC
ncbi:uncharacterized protein LOC120084811 [Benincasa hispida]|uniref:uncharacterized protein LOC120084811 n=1 Tax=Benincasa hispida TaxID=102211 RepID=UPI0018FF2ACF|nr:uncharacterized protein LOC120084811 [Benincasa hispida]